MAGFPKAQRQAIIDGYLNETGRNLFIPGEFIDWLQDQPDNPAYPWFFAMDDEAAARSYRVDLARRMASGLRIVAKHETAEAKSVTVTTREFPAYISPMSGRKSGGGYTPFDPGNSDAMDELRRQGAAALRSWLVRYRGAFEATGLDLGLIEQIAASQDGGVALVA